VASWWRAVKCSAIPDEYSEYVRRVQAGLRAADVVAAPTRAMLEALASEYRFDTPSLVIPNAIRSRSCLRTKEDFVLTIGRLWDAAKNVPAVAAAAQGLPWRVYLAGDSKGADFDNVTMLGRLDRDQVSSWFERASIYALPARYEPFGLSVLEAAQAGCALVLGDIPSLKENWSGAALFVAPDDWAALRDVLTYLMENSEFREDLGRRALDRAARFLVAGMVHDYLGLYGMAAARRHSRLEESACVS
jgi:glycosyltransferase involved in cell wall biosynthesis